MIKTMNDSRHVESIDEDDVVNGVERRRGYHRRMEGYGRFRAAEDEPAATGARDVRGVAGGQGFRKNEETKFSRPASSRSLRERNSRRASRRGCRSGCRVGCRGEHSCAYQRGAPSDARVGRRGAGVASPRQTHSGFQRCVYFYFHMGNWTMTSCFLTEYAAYASWVAAKHPESVELAPTRRWSRHPLGPVIGSLGVRAQRMLNGNGLCCPGAGVVRWMKLFGYQYAGFEIGHVPSCGLDLPRHRDSYGL